MHAGLDVAHRLHGRDHEAQQQRDEGGRVEADVEGGRPASRGGRGEGGRAKTFLTFDPLKPHTRGNTTRLKVLPQEL